jgi:hypothetical protein
MAGNILKEFAPDLYSKVRKKKHAPSYSGTRPSNLASADVLAGNPAGRAW